MKVSYELEQGYIDVWNEESEEWDRYIKANKKSVMKEEKKIPENKLLYREEYVTQDACIDDIIRQFNQLTDYLKSKGDE